MPGACRGQQKALGSLELELQMCLCVCAVNQTQGPLQEQQVPLTTRLALQSLNLLDWNSHCGKGKFVSLGTYILEHVAKQVDFNIL